MSNFSSFKNVQPAFQQLTTEKVWKKLREPFSIAILASLGFHGLLWFGLPLLSNSAPKQPDQRTLNVVELSPLEQQARLPQMPNLLQPFAPLPKDTLPKAPTGTLPMVPMNPPVVDPDTFYQVPDLTTRRTTPDFVIIAKPPTRKSTPKPQPETAPVEPTAPTDDTPKPDQPSTRAEDLTQPDGQPPSKSREDQEKVALQQSFAFNAAGTSTQDVNSNLASAAAKISEKFNIPNWEGKPIAIAVPYPKAACPFQQDGKPVQGTTGLAVVMLPDGSFGDTALKIKSSGFAGLDQAATQFIEKQWSEIVKQGNLEPGQKPKAFVLEMTIAPAATDCAATEKPPA